MTSDLEEVLRGAERVAAQLVEGGRELLRWEWDGRFSAALAVVKAPGHEPVLELLARLFPFAWDSTSVARAPEPVRAVADDWGLKAGQRLFTLDPGDDPLLFAAWWPWGNGNTFSVRVGCIADDEAAEKADPDAQLRRWFGL